MKSIDERIADLQESVLEEEAASIDQNSIDHLVTFLKENPLLRRPSLGVSPDLSMVADWRVSNQQLCHLSFLPDGQVRYLVFTPKGDGHETIKGLVAIKDLRSLLESLPLDWMKS